MIFIKNSSGGGGREGHSGTLKPLEVLIYQNQISFYVNPFVKSCYSHLLGKNKEYLHHANDQETPTFLHDLDIGSITLA